MHEEVLEPQHLSGANMPGVELFDPATDSFSVTKGGLNFPRLRPTATLLMNGKVLVAGGNGATGNLDSAEIYDPGTETFTLAVGHLAAPRFLHTAA
jgi:hypothetical protein